MFQRFLSQSVASFQCTSSCVARYRLQRRSVPASRRTLHYGFVASNFAGQRSLKDQGPRPDGENAVDVCPAVLVHEDLCRELGYRGSLGCEQLEAANFHIFGLLLCVVPRMG